MHYYEDGNVRMSTSKTVEAAGAGASGAEAVVREIAKAENKFQEELNRAFVQLAEGSFKGLRRQLPVTRQRVEWEKIGGYRVSDALFFYGCVMRWCTDVLYSLARILAVDVRSRSSLAVDELTCGFHMRDRWNRHTTSWHGMAFHSCVNRTFLPACDLTVLRLTERLRSSIPSKHNA